MRRGPAARHCRRPPPPGDHADGASAMIVIASSSELVVVVVASARARRRRAEEEGEEEEAAERRGAGEPADAAAGHGRYSTYVAARSCVLQVFDYVDLDVECVYIYRSSFLLAASC